MYPTTSGLVIISFNAGVQYNLTAHLRLNVFNDQPNLTRTELGRHSHGAGMFFLKILVSGTTSYSET